MSSKVNSFKIRDMTSTEELKTSSFKIFSTFSLVKNPNERASLKFLMVSTRFPYACFPSLHVTSESVFGCHLGLHYEVCFDYFAIGIARNKLSLFTFPRFILYLLTMLIVLLTVLNCLG